jgi:GT2 family glycosyltransferase
MKTENPKDFPLVSIITINYNQAAVTLEFLESMRHCTYPNYEIWVVDNASPTENPDVIKEKFPDIHFVKTEKNLGFAGGNNVAVRKAKGDYLLFINNDTEVEPGFLEPMVELLEKNPEIGMVSPRIQYFHSKNILQFAGFTPLNAITTRNFAIGFGEEDKGQYNMTCETGSIFGAAMLVPRVVAEKVGLMTEVFFLYYEEHDWASHIKHAGYKIYYQGKSLVFHKESISTVKNSPFQIYYMTRGRVLYARRNSAGFVKILSLLYIYLITVPKITLGYLLKGRLDLIHAFWRAMYWNLTHHKEVYKTDKLTY